MGLQHSKVVILHLKRETQRLQIPFKIYDLLHTFANFWICLFQILQGIPSWSSQLKSSPDEYANMQQDESQKTWRYLQENTHMAT